MDSPSGPQVTWKGTECWVGSDRPLVIPGIEDQSLFELCRMTLGTPLSQVKITGEDGGVVVFGIDKPERYHIPTIFSYSWRFLFRAMLWANYNRHKVPEDM